MLPFKSTIFSSYCFRLLKEKKTTLDQNLIMILLSSGSPIQSSVKRLIKKETMYSEIIGGFKFQESYLRATAVTLLIKLLMNRMSSIV